MAAIIELKSLYKTFGAGENQVNALKNVSVSVEKGDIFGIIGLSGAGKSTLVRCINLLERPDRFSGVDPSTYQVNGLTPGAEDSRTYFPSTRQFIVGLQVDF